jgi:hypothetical protein
MTTSHGWRAAALFAAAIALVVSCGKPSGPSASNPVTAPTSPSPSASQLSVSTRCFGPFRPGTYYGLACVAEVSETLPPRLATYRLLADLRILGGPAEVTFPACPACGGRPTFDIDLRIPSEMTPGVKSIPVWVTDADGRRAETTAAVEIVAR